MGIKRFDHKTKVKARLERRNLQTASQLCTKQVGTGKINQIIESLLKVDVMNIEWDYNYYQPWSDNEWLIDKMLVMLDKDIIMQ